MDLQNFEGGALKYPNQEAYFDHGALISCPKNGIAIQRIEWCRVLLEPSVRSPKLCEGVMKALFVEG